MDLIKKTEKIKNKIFKFIEKELEQKYKKIFLFYDSKKIEIFNIYKEFIKNGKGIRGSLVFLTNKIFNGKKINEKSLYYLSSFFEIIHSTLLIHDDFMDQDKTRRNQKTINYYFEKKFKNNSFNPNHLGNSISVNIGDIGFFIAFDLLNKIKTNLKTKQNLINTIVNEYIKVALGQIDDVLFSQTDLDPNDKIIEKIYLHKTARYTFVLPVISTLILKENNFYKNKNLIKILENLGIIFQITDDIIGFLSDETGKDIASDIRENKKTLIRYYLIKELNKDLKNIFGKKDLKKEEILNIRSFYQNSKTKKIIKQIINNLKKETKHLLEKEKFTIQFKNLINNFLDFLIKRKK